METIKRIAPFVILALCVIALLLPFVLQRFTAQEKADLSNNDRELCDSYAPNSNTYATCKMEQYAKDAVTGIGPITCDNMYVYETDCRELRVVQRAVQAGDSAICHEIGPTFANPPTREYTLCIGQFPGSTEWSAGCKEVEQFVGGFGDTAGNASNFLVTGRCLTKETANVQLPGSGKGHDPFDRYGDTYKSRVQSLGRSDIYTPYAPAWFEELRTWTKADYDYLRSVGTNPNATDDFGRTALVLEIQERLYLNDYTDQNFDDLPESKQPAAAEKGVENMKLLMEFGVDPNKADILHMSAMDYARQIRNVIFREKALQVLQNGTAISTEVGWLPFYKKELGFFVNLPDWLALRKTDTMDDGTIWFMFNNNRNSSTYGFDIILRKPGPPVGVTGTPISDSCLSGAQLLVGTGQSSQFKTEQMTVSGAPAERLQQLNDGRLIAEFFSTISNNRCYIIRAIETSVLKDTETLTRIFQSFKLE